MYGYQHDHDWGSIPIMMPLLWLVLIGFVAWAVVRVSRGWAATTIRSATALPLLGAAALLVLAGCGGTSPSGGGTPSATPMSPSSTPAPSAGTSPSVSQSPPTSRLTPAAKPLTIYYIAVGDNGRSGPRIGCGDSAVATSTAPVRTMTPVGSSIRTLLQNHSRDIGQSGLINVLYQSTLTYRSAAIHGSTVTVYLSGSFHLGGVCDIPRAKAELEYTAMKAAHATRAVIYIDGKTIDQKLSLK